MSPSTEKEPRARVFFALDPPEEVRAGITAWQARNGADPALRATKSETLHLTLCFLGSHPESALERIVAHLDPALAREVEVTLEPVPRPLPARRPGLYAIGATSDGAVELQAALVGRLIADGLYEAEKRPFWPHLTVFRVRSQGGGKRRPARVEEPPKTLPPSLLSPFFCRRIALYRSYLRPGGSHYVSLASLELPRPA